MKLIQASFVWLVSGILTTGAVWADVTVESVTKTGGVRGMGGSETTSTEFLQGTNRRADSTIKYDGKLMNRMAGGEKSEILLVSQDKAYHLDHKRKAYRESTLSGMAKQMEEMQKAGPEPEERAAVDEKPTHRITQSEFKVNPTGEKKTLNGFNCEKYIVTMMIEAEELETKQKTKTRLVTDQWTTPETAALKQLSQAEKTFSEAYMKKLGWNLSARDAQQFGMAVMSASMGVSEKDMRARMEALKKEMSKVKGYPVATEVKWFMESDAMAQAAEARREELANVEEDDGSVDLSGGAAGILGGMAGKFARKKAAERKAAKPKSSGDEPAFSSYMEIRRVETAAIPGDKFQVPAGYKKAKD